MLCINKREMDRTCSDGVQTEYEISICLQKRKVSSFNEVNEVSLHVIIDGAVTSESDTAIRMTGH